MRLQKWYPPALSSLEEVTSVFCLSDSHFGISNWVSLTYCLGVFQTCFLMDLRASWSAVEPFKRGFSAAAWVGGVQRIPTGASRLEGGLQK